MIILIFVSVKGAIYLLSLAYPNIDDDTEKIGTPITKDDFGDAKQGTKIIDANGNYWTIADIPINRNPVSDVSRDLISPEEKRNHYQYTNIDGVNYIVGGKDKIIVELNQPNVKIFI